MNALILSYVKGEFWKVILNKCREIKISYTLRGKTTQFNESCLNSEYKPMEQNLSVGLIENILRVNSLKHVGRTEIDANHVEAVVRNVDKLLP